MIEFPAVSARDRQEVIRAAFSIMSKQFANVPQQSCTRDRKFCKTFANVSILNAAKIQYTYGTLKV